MNRTNAIIKAKTTVKIILIKPILKSKIVKPILTKPITIVYKLDAEQLKFAKKAFDKIEKVGDGLYAITHNTWGWTKNNRNIDGALLLPYSSETHQH